MEAASAEEATGEGSTTEGAGAGDTMEALAKASHYVTHPLSGKLLYSRRRDGPRDRGVRAGRRRRGELEG